MAGAVVTENSSEEVVARAPAKINLYLEVIGRRPDGYHELVSLMQKLPLCDVLHVRRREADIVLACPGSHLPTTRDNLVYQAAERFLARHAPHATGVSLTLEKHIPIAAGLGGGSSDAAATLLALRLLLAPELPDEALLAMARELGADVAFFVAPWEAAWATGRGDVLEEAVPLRGHDVVLLNPGFAVSTRWVYESFSLTGKKHSNKIFSFSFDAGGRQNPFAVTAISLAALRNDLEAVTAGRYPEIDAMRQALLNEGAMAVLMSGSGPTVFGVFRAGSVTEALRDRLARRFCTVIVLPAEGCSEKMGWGVVKR